MIDADLASEMDFPSPESSGSAWGAENTCFPNARVDDGRSSELNQLEPSNQAGFPNVDRCESRAVAKRHL